MERKPAEAVIGGVLRGGHVIGGNFVCHTPAPLSIPIETIKEWRYV
jgi:hypothetical protein